MAAPTSPFYNPFKPSTPTRYREPEVEDPLSSGARSYANARISASQKDPYDAEIKVVNQRKTNVRYQKEGMKNHLNKFLETEGADLFERDVVKNKLMTNEDGTYVPKLGREVEELRKKTQQTTGLIAGALSPSKQRGDPTDDAVAAQKRLAEIEPSYRLKQEKYDRIQAQIKRLDDADIAHENRLGELGAAREARYTVTPQDVASAVSEVNTGRAATGAQPVSVDDLQPKGKNKSTTLGSPAEYPKEVFATLKDPATGADIGRTIAPEAVRRQAQFDAKARKIDPVGAETVELARLRDAGVTHVGERPIDELIEARGGDAAIAKIKTSETYKKINGRIEEIDNSLVNAGAKLRPKLERERAVLEQLAAKKKALLDTLPDIGRVAEDAAMSFGSGSGALLKMAGDIYGLITGDMNNAVSLYGKEVMETYAPHKSARLRSLEASRRSVVDAQPDELGKYWTYLKETLANPELATGMVAEQLPNTVGTGGVGIVAKQVTARVLLKAATTEAAKKIALRQATAVGVGAAVGAGAAMQGADVGADQFDRLTVELEAMPAAEAAQIPAIATLMERGATLDEAKLSLVMMQSRLTAGAAGAVSLVAQNLPGGKLIEKTIVGGARKQVAGGVAKQVAGRAASAAVGGVGEVVSEMVEEGAGNLATNIAARPVDPIRPLTEGMGETLAQAALVGGGMGAAAGALNVEKDSPAAPASPGAAPAAPVPPAAPTAAAPAAPAPAATPAVPSETSEPTLDDQETKTFEVTNAKGATVTVEATRETDVAKQLPADFGPVKSIKRVETPARESATSAAAPAEPGARESSPTPITPESAKPTEVAGNDVPTAGASPAPVSETIERAREVYRKVLAVSPEGNSTWHQQAREQIENPERYHEIEEVENPKGLKIGDTVTVAPTEDGVRVRNEKPYQAVVVSVGKAQGTAYGGGFQVKTAPLQVGKYAGFTGIDRVTKGGGDTSTASAPAPAPAPAIARGTNKPRTFIAAVSKAGGLKGSDKATKFLSDFVPRLHKANPTEFENMEVHVLTDAEWKANERTGSSTPDSAAAYNPETNTLYFNSDKVKGGDGVDLISAVVHESGHFAEKFALGEAFSQREWEKLGVAGMRSAWREYNNGKLSAEEMTRDFTNDKRARSEWVAMQFARVIKGETDGMPKTVREKLTAYLETVRELVKKWVGSKALTTAELDSWILDKMGLASKAEQAAASAPPPTGATEPTSAPKPAATDETALQEKWWDESLTTAGRADKLKAAGVDLPARVKWRHVSPENRAKLDHLRTSEFRPAPPKPGTRLTNPDGSYYTVEKEPTPAPAEAPGTYGENVTAAADEILKAIEAKQTLTWRDLFAITDKAFGGTQAGGAYSVKDAYDSMELAVNKWIAKGEGIQDGALTTSNVFKARAAIVSLQEVLDRLPTQTKRTAEQDQLQQFSTPPPLAFVANWAANLRASDVYLEPSAGPGGLLAFGKAAGVKTIIANEFSERRIDVLRESGIADTVFGYNAENLNAQLDPRLKSGAIDRPTVVVMNPPFSNGAESGKRGDTMVGAKHVEEALKILAPGGRLVAIVGEGMADGKPTFRAWWNTLRTKYNVRANIGINGEEYRKYGTTFGNQILVIDNTGPTTGQPVTSYVDNFDQLPSLLKGIRDDRPDVQKPSPASAESSGGKSPLKGEGATSGKPGADAAPLPGERPSAGGRSPAAGVKPVVSKPKSPTGGARPAGKSPRSDGTAGGKPAGDSGTDSGGTRPGSGNPGSGLKPGGFNVSDELRGALDDLFGTPSDVLGTPGTSNEFTQKFGGDFERANKLVGLIVRDNPTVRSRATLAAFLSSAAPKAKPFSESLFKILSAAIEADESGSAADWQSLYAQPEPAATPEPEPTAPQEPRAPAKPINDEDVFTEYTPAKLRIQGALPHPTPLVESAAMASVQPPDVVYKPNIPREVITGGKLSEAQLEAVVYAGQAHSKALPSGERRGFFIGDGTGVGKGREIAAIVMDNWRSGRKRAVWISKTGTLAEDARRDLRAVGMKDDLLTPINKAAKSGTGTIGIKEGILFSTYTSLAKDYDGMRDGVVRRRNAEKKTRIEQIVEWLGKDFDGVIAFDEAHMAGNAVPMKSNRGMKDASNTGIAVVDLQALLPQARIVYVSATGATEVSNLSYADRLGIWGRNTPFATKFRFFEQISSGGVSAMEIVARDLKALGSYLARTLSFKGVKFESLQQTLNTEQLKIYDTIADSWSVVFQNMDEAMAVSGASKNRRARSAARSAFFGAQQRFFNQILTAMEMPSVVKGVREALDAGHSAVLQLVNTNEATQDREIARVTTEEQPDLEDLDLSPKDILLQYVNNSFPTTLYQEIADPNNPEKTVWVPVLDEKGDPVQDPEAVKRKDRLLMEIQTIAMPENPLEQMLNTFGYENVAEITGRGQRVIMKKNEEGNVVRALEQNRTEARRKVEAQEFQDGKRRILIFSGAGGTGFSYHASRQALNKQLRVHFLVQAGWRADAALQGFGRTHRSDQEQPPLYKLVTTDIQGHKRFISTIARRLAQLGALTAGERKSTGQGLFSEKDNLESVYADNALTRFFHDLHNNLIEEMSFADLTKQMGFGHSKRGGDGQPVWTSSLVDEKTGQLNVGKLPTIQQFLNRLLALRVGLQNQVFDAFFTRLETRIENAKADGTYDPGTQTYKAKEIHKVSDETVYRHPDSTAATRLVEIDALNDVSFLPFSDIGAMGSNPVERYVRNKKSGRVYALKEGPTLTNTTTGGLTETFRRLGTHSTDIHPRTDFTEGEEGKYEVLGDAAAEAAWNDEIDKADKTHAKREYFIVGSFLPIWDRIQIASPKIFRFNTAEGEAVIGALIPPKLVDSVKRRLGAKVSTKSPAEIVASIVDDGKTLALANGWRMKRVMVSGQKRIEIAGLAYEDIADFTDNIGGFTERISYTTRFFMPSEGPQAAEAMQLLLEKSPIADESDSPTLGTPATHSAAEPLTAEEAERMTPKELNQFFTDASDMSGVPRLTPDARAAGTAAKGSPEQTAFIKKQLDDMRAEFKKTLASGNPDTELGFASQFWADAYDAATDGPITQADAAMGERYKDMLGTPPVPLTATEKQIQSEEFVGTMEDKRTIGQKISDVLADLRDYAATELRQKMVDSFHSLRRLEERVFGRGVEIDAAASPLKAARNTKGLPEQMKVLMEDSQLEYRGGSVVVKPGTKGLFQILKPLEQTGLLKLWENYVAAVRADRLLEEGKEKNFGKELDPVTGKFTWDKARARAQIDERLALASAHPEFESIRQEYVAFQQSLLEMATKAGLINNEQRALWEKMDYVPFYRMTDAIDGVKGPHSRRGLANQRSGIRQLKGGMGSVAIVENMMRNAASLLNASVKNNAMRLIADFADSASDLLVPIPYKAVPFKASVEEVLATLEQAGVDVSGLSTAEAEEFVKFWRMQAPKGKDVVSVMLNGKAKYYRVKDAPLLRSILALGPAQHSWWMKALMQPKNLLTNFVTLDPAFMVANTVRDSFSAWVMADSPIKPGYDSAIGFAKSLRNSPSKIAMMAAGGGSGHYNALQQLPEAREYLRKLTPGAQKTFRESIVDTAGKAWDVWKEVGRASENANRIPIFDSATKRGATPAEAAFQSRDIMDFSLRGDSALLGFFLDTVPFLNARIQGLYKLGRASGIGQGDGITRLLPHGKHAVYGAIITGATLALLGKNWDDERYWALPEWERDVYYHFWLGDRHVRIPKGFEVGQIFSTIPERVAEYLGKTGDGKLLGRRMLAMVADTFAMNPLPQALKPVAERAMNLNTFTQRPIISRSDEFKQPEQQFNVLTSETMRELAEAMPDSAPAWMRSPKTLEHFVRGYFGSIGMYSLAATDALTRAAIGAPDDPEIKSGDWWVMKRFAPSSDLRETKYVSQFYDLHKEITGLARQVKELQKSDPEQARRLQAENRDLINFAPRSESTYDQLTSLRKQERAVYASTANPEAKRRRLGELTTQRNQAAQRTVEMSPRRTRPVFNPF